MQQWRTHAVEEVHAQGHLVGQSEAEGPWWGPAEGILESSQGAPLHEFHDQAQLGGL